MKLITPYLLSNEAAKIYRDLLQSELSIDHEINRDRIIQCVIKLENNDKFKLDRNRGIPHHLAATQLGILDAVPDPVIPTFLAQVPPSVTSPGTNTAALAADVISQPGAVQLGQVVRPGQPGQAPRPVGRDLNLSQGPVQTIASGQTIQHILCRDQSHARAQLIL